ncbi:hypothetical protein HNP55_004548 [Paucibacter oligotrophus]|uniref:Peptidase C14 caspase domain-containing protein n=1 Tax=Roseateles oligotrophus TaxID=1769250 RepID=A0A840LBL6_9BURK|nr:caspase family protein [Roseateles oligotrophus]MBB4845994.1 hypothetical protein [Roseateles oligotrophus]
MRRWCGAVGLSLLAGTALAANHALLVGVSAYPHLPGKSLEGPANDVALMARSLAELGFEAGQVRVLSEASGEPPTRAAIVQNLARLAGQARAGDWVLVYLSGHGAQVPQPQQAWRKSGGRREADGLQEVFLPRDTWRWSAEQQAVQGALPDREIGQALQRIRSRGAHVWAVLDTCHAADLLRRPGHAETWRYASPLELQIPLPLWLARWQEGLQRGGLQRPPPAERHPSAGVEGQFVGFFAAQEDEGALEELLPAPDGGPRQRYGLFTYRLALALRGWQGSFLDLAEALRASYRERPFPHPQFVGALSSRPGFGLAAR